MKKVFDLKLKWLFSKINSIKGNDYDDLVVIYDSLLDQFEKKLSPEQETRVNDIYDTVRSTCWDYPEESDNA